MSTNHRTLTHVRSALANPNTIQRRRSDIIIQILKDAAPHRLTLTDVVDLWPEAERDIIPNAPGKPKGQELSPTVAECWLVAICGWEYVNRANIGTNAPRYEYWIDMTQTPRPGVTQRPFPRKSSRKAAKAPKAPVAELPVEPEPTEAPEPFLTPIQQRYIAQAEQEPAAAPVEPQGQRFNVVAEKLDGTMLIEIDGVLFKATPFAW